MPKHTEPPFKPTDVTSIEFFLDDLSSFNEQIEKNEELYGEVHKLLSQTNGSSYFSGGVRNVAELGRTLASIRSTGIEAVNKRFQAKRSLADMEHKKKQLDIDKESSSNIETARLMLQTLHEEERARLLHEKGRPTPQRGNTVEDADQLEKRVSKALEEGNLNLTRNDKAMKHAFKGVTYAYDVTNEEFVARSKTGEILEDFPRERVPYKKVIQLEEGAALCDNGDRIPLINGEE